MSIFRYEPHPALSPAALGEVDTLLNDLALPANLVELPIRKELARAEAQVVSGGPGAAPQEAGGPTEEDKAEFKLVEPAVTSETDTLEKYLAKRCAVFGDAPGSDTEYKKYAAIADAEFESLKNVVLQAEDPVPRRKILYRWLRKAYEANKITDPVAVIKAGIHPDMKAKTDAVADKLAGRKFEGFCPRPQKKEHGKYILGTLSEHGTGKALDVAADKNPQIPSGEWTWLKTFTGKQPVLSDATWKASPEKVWEELDEMNEAFKTKLKAKVDELTKVPDPAPAKDAPQGGAPAPAPPAKPAFATRKEAIADVLKGRKVLLKCVQDHGEDNGFFELPKDLVVACAQQGLKWGALFDTVDPMHFEMD
jgi:hypothetical protein